MALKSAKAAKLRVDQTGFDGGYWFPETTGAGVAILDFDVHHGNGTEEIFLADDRVLLCSSYQHPFYPYTGAPSVPGHIANVPLPAGTQITMEFSYDNSAANPFNPSDPPRRVEWGPESADEMGDLFGG